MKASNLERKNSAYNIFWRTLGKHLNFSVFKMIKKKTTWSLRKKMTFLYKKKECRLRYNRIDGKIEQNGIEG